MAEREQKLDERADRPHPGEPDSAAHALTKLEKAGKWKQAVELAKERHKKQTSPESERRLVDAYMGRIQQFQSKGAHEDARTLLKLVSERFPAHRDRLKPLELFAAAGAGDLESLIAPLADPAVSPEVRQHIETAIRTEIIDLAKLAGAATLAPDHPLRVVAAATRKAFEAVVAGPVTDEQIALPEVSRRSPLAAWKLLIRAIALFYRNDDDGVRRSVELIPADAAAARLSPVLLAIIDHRPPLPGIAGTLQQRICGGDAALRQALSQLDYEFSVRSPGHRGLRQAAQAALSACVAARPEMAPVLRRHILAAAYGGSISLDESTRLAGAFIANAQLWKLLATVAVDQNDVGSAAEFWERYLVHAVQEGLFLADSLEAAMVSGRIATYASQVSKRTRLTTAEDRRYLFDVLYRNQPPEIAALAPDQKWCPPFDAERWYRRSIRIRPDEATFQEWLQWTLAGVDVQSQSDKKMADRRAEPVLKEWRQALPEDPRPLIMMAQAAERRSAFKTALAHLQEAEAVDAIHPAVRELRLRLTAATAWRHMKEKKPHLLARDLDELSALPAMREGDRPALLLAMHAVCAAIENNPAEAARLFGELEQRIGEGLSAEMIRAVLMTGRLDRGLGPKLPDTKTPAPHLMAEWIRRLWSLSPSLGLNLTLPKDWHGPLSTVLAKKPCPIPLADVMAVGQFAAERATGLLAYVASSAGLETAHGVAAARFLLIRARSLQGRYPQDRIYQCLLAARTLTQQAHETALLAEISSAFELMTGPFGSRVAPRPISDELLAKILTAERGASAFPTSYDALNKPLVVEMEMPPMFGASPFGGDDLYDVDDDDDDDYDDYDGLGELPNIDQAEPGPFDFNALKGLPPELAGKAKALITELASRYPTRPSLNELMEREPHAVGRLLVMIAGMDPDAAPPGVLQEIVDRIKSETRPSARQGSRKRRKR